MDDAIEFVNKYFNSPGFNERFKQINPFLKEYYFKRNHEDYDSIKKYKSNS